MSANWWKIGGGSEGVPVGGPAGGRRERYRVRGRDGGSGKRRASSGESPHSTDNVTFFNPRFTLFALSSTPSKRSRGSF